MTQKKKLIEVALPLEAINRESAKEKEPFTRNHPRSLHTWWARRPLVVCRAVVFASLVDDPSAHPDRFPTTESQEAERLRLFSIIEDLVKWENSCNPDVLEGARAEIRASCDGELPLLIDPFAGGGSIPVEAQRLGLGVHASDLNPVAVLINKALVEIPARFGGFPPVHQLNQGNLDLDPREGASGLAADVRHYGAWIGDEAQRRIGNHYPHVRLSPEDGGSLAPVVAWVWARTVRCPNPACGAITPLASTFVLSSRKGRARWVVPKVEGKSITFTVGGPEGSPSSPPKLGRGARFACVACSVAMDDEHLKTEGMSGRIGVQLLATIAEGNRSRLYVSPNKFQSDAANVAVPDNIPRQRLPEDPRNVWCKSYGFEEWQQLFTARQLSALRTFCDLVLEVRGLVQRDALRAGMAEEQTPLRDGGSGAFAYAEAVMTYLGLALSKWTDLNNALCSWNITNQNITHLFTRHAIPMTWDFVELNCVGSLASYTSSVDAAARALEAVRCGAQTEGVVMQLDARVAELPRGVISTDPPYYDNISYGDLSDFFFVWLREALRDVFPQECSTLLVPKSQELIASPYRFGGDRKAAERFFEIGLGEAFKHIRDAQDRRYPMTVYYAFKQAESSASGVASTGWETMLEGLLDAGFAIDGTWPMRSERGDRMISIGTNTLATAIVLVCRHRATDAPLATRREFLSTLKRDLPPAVRTLQQGHIAPVDLAQAAIGPGMAVFSQYAKVVEADGSAMTVRAGLRLINQVLDETLAEQESDFDSDTRWALAWFEQFGMSAGEFGQAETLSKAKNTAVGGMVEAGILESRAGEVRLLDRSELPERWDPAADTRLTVWEVTQHLIRALETGGELAAAELLRRVGGLGETALELAYRLYVICERNKWANEAIAYNSVVVAWPEIARLGAVVSAASAAQGSLL